MLVNDEADATMVRKENECAEAGTPNSTDHVLIAPGNHSEYVERLECRVPWYICLRLRKSQDRFLTSVPSRNSRPCCGKSGFIPTENRQRDSVVLNPAIDVMRRPTDDGTNT